MKRSGHLDEYCASLKTLLRERVSKPNFYDGMVYKLRKILGYNQLDSLFVKIMRTLIKRDYDQPILQRTACFVIEPFTVGSNAFIAYRQILEGASM